MQANGVLLALRKMFAPPAYALLEQVRNQTGFRAGPIRTIDALVMSLYPSRGLTLAAIEVKVSRSDFLREIKDPDKAESIARFCDEFWIASPAGILTKDDLPPNWGWISVKNGRATRVIAAKQLQPQPLTRAMLASIFRNLESTYVPRRLIGEMVEERVAQASTRWSVDKQYEIERLTRRVQNLEQAAKDFERASGISIDHYTGERLGDAVRKYLSQRDVRQRSGTNVKAAIEQLKRATAALEKIEL